MALQLDTAEHACNLISREIRDHQKNLHIHYIVHHEGQRTEALGMAAQNILWHPASETAMHFLQKPKRIEDSALLGTAVARQNIFLGLVTRYSVLALCTINVDQFESLKDVKRHAYHLAWHALDAVDYHSNPAHRTGAAREVIVRKRNALEIADANLHADIFSAAISFFFRDKDAVRRIALKRGLNAISAKTLHSPEFYPYTIAVEATEFALNETDMKQITKKTVVPTSLRVAREVSKAYDEINLKNWLAFTESAQEMAWRGYDEEEILAAAISTSPNTYVRATGYLIAELAAIDPKSVLDIKENFNPFVDDQFNETLHMKLMDDIYQDVIAQGLRQDSAVPFIDMANRQNTMLSDGRTLGWCASALQAAGAAYEKAKEEGGEPEELATLEFENKKNAASWDDLRDLGDRIIGKQRQGDNVTLNQLKEISKDLEGLRELRKSVEQTMMDPQYQHRLAAANERNRIPESELAAAGPQAGPKAAPKTPAPAPISVPGFGKMLGGIVGSVKKAVPAQDGKQEPQSDHRE